MENSKPTQAQRVLDYINKFGSITQLEALQEIGVMRLASRVSELKKAGHSIVGKTILEISNGKRPAMGCLPFLSFLTARRFYVGSAADSHENRLLKQKGHLVGE